MSSKNCLYNDVKKYRDLREVVKDAVDKFSGKTAFIEKIKDGENVTYRNISYKEFKEEIDGLASSLISLGLKDKKIAILSQNRYEWIESYFTIVNGVGVVVPLDRSLPKDEVISLLRRSKVDAVIFDRKYKDIMKEIKDTDKENNVKYYICIDKEESDDFISYDKLIEKGKQYVKENSDYYKQYVNAEIDPKEMRMLLYTSGTTSMSKAVMLCHENIVTELYGLESVLKLYPEKDRYLEFLPLHHTLGTIVMIFIFATGGETAFCEGLRHIQENMIEYKPTIFVAVPLLIENIYKKIMKQVEKKGKLKKVEFGRKLCNFLLKFGIDIRRKVFKEIIDNLGGLRVVISGAASLDKEVAKAFNEMGIELVQGYGLTETSPVITVENDKYVKYGSVGFPLIDVEVKIEDPDENGIGEIKTKGPIVMLGYYEMEEETKEVLTDDGWFYTGDLGYIDDEGYLFVTGRKKYVIVLKNGKNIYPEELENLINKLPYVSECIVFGYPKDDDLVVTAKIVYNKEYVEDVMNGITKEELEKIIWQDIKKINSTLSTFKHIKKIVVTDEPMIKTTTAKIKKLAEIEKTIKEIK